MDHQILSDFLNHPYAELENQRIQLIRILSRSGTLPKVADLQVQYIHSQPEMFLIQPGKQLRIGVRLLQQPVLALVALRYGIEWHIWYNAVKKIDPDCRIPDLAAARVAVRFMELLPDDDREELFRNFPDDLKDLFAFISSPQFALADFNHADIGVISKFHKLEAPKRPIKQEWLNIIEQLAVPTEALMMRGGDLRLNIETKNLLNVYGCRPFPRPEAFSFASSTATSISNIAYDLTQKQREILISESFKIGLASAISFKISEFKNRLKEVLHLNQSVAIAMAPSGTDIALLLAGICQSVYHKPICHIIVASDETGSGVPMALAGCHFAEVSALGKPVKKEEAVKGFRSVSITKIPLRKPDGSLKSHDVLDIEVEKAVAQSISEGCQVVLHIMDQSKLGYASPSMLCIQKLAKQHKGDVLLNVDSSQLRMDLKKINEYLKLGCLITLTGSKFYTGPPFSGALLLPEKFAKRLNAIKQCLPVGLADYFYKSEFFNELPMADSLASEINIGSYLRWYAALVEIERYYDVPETLRNLGTALFCEHVAGTIASLPFLEALENGDSNAVHPVAEGTRTIFPFFIKKNNKVLTHAESDEVYRWLNQDISNLIPEATEEETRLARQACHIGQPVKVVYKDGTQSAVLRISLGSRVLADSWKDRDVSLFFQKLQNQQNQVDFVGNKIALLLKYYPKLHLGGKPN